MALVLFGLIVAAGVIAAVLLSQRRAGGGDVAGPLGEVAQALQALRGDTAVLGERISAVQTRVGAIEQRQEWLGQDIAKTGVLAQGLKSTADGIRADLATAREGLTALQSRAASREGLEQQTAESIRRLEQVLAGTAAKGAAGENLVDLVFSRLPVEWQLRGFRVGNRTVEFALRLPNGLAMPIDSKWPATALLEEFIAAGPQDRPRIKGRIEEAVREKAREVTKYLDPELTINLGVAVVPDAVYDLCSEVQGDCARMNVALVGYSMFVPYLLLVFQTVLRTSRDLDLEKLAAVLAAAEQSLKAIADEVEGRLSRTLVMLGNSRDELRVQASRATGQLSAVAARMDPEAAPK